MNKLRVTVNYYAGWVFHCEVFEFDDADRHVAMTRARKLVEDRSATTSVVNILCEDA